MTGSTISNTVATTVTLGSATYPSPLIVTAAGKIAPIAVPPNFTGLVNGYNGVIGITGGLSLINDGSIFGGAPLAGQSSRHGVPATNGGNGGIAVDLAGGGNLENAGTIMGSAGGAGGYDKYSLNSGSGGAGGVGVVFGGGGSITNSGSIIGGAGGAGGSAAKNLFSSVGAGGAGGDGIVLTAQDTLTNSGVIAAGRGGAGGQSEYGTALAGSAGGTGVVLNGGSVLNTGTLIGGAGGLGAVTRNGGNGGAGGAGVDIIAGVFTNGSTGSLSGGAGGGGGNTSFNGSGGAAGAGGDGVVITGGTLINQGTIAGGRFAYGGGGHYGNGPASNPGYGVYINGGTVIDTGFISNGFGLVSHAVTFGAVAGTLEVGAGARFSGAVLAKAGVADVLEFGVGASVSDIGYYGHITGFTNLSFATGASASAAGMVSSFDAKQTIAGFALGDTLVLDGFAANPTDVTYVAGTGLELTAGGTPITLDITGDHLSTDFVVATASGDTTITMHMPCFVAGTRILTTKGEIAVEHLSPGDAIVLVSGETAPLVWLGHRRIDLTRHHRPEQVRPILIEAGAITGGIPARDLLVSPDHALYLEGHLIPAKALINGATIRQVDLRTVTYYHVELPAHAVLYAEGTPAESYLETGNRGAFENGGVPVELHPDFAQSLREARSYAPFVTAGRIVERVRRRLLARTGIITTSDPRLAIRRRADGAAIIESRSAIPGHITHDPRDCRRLGIKVATLTIDGATLPLGHTALTKGWHKPEADGRWTDGAGVIPASLLSDSSEIAVTLAATLAYPLVGSAAQPRHSAR